MIPGSNAWYEPPTAGPCVCKHDLEEHERVPAVTGYVFEVCHGAADCECSGFEERDDREQDRDDAAYARWESDHGR